MNIKSKIPNCITVFRLFLLPVFLAVFWLIPEKRWAFAVFLLASVSDIIDGYLARKWHAVSNFGKVVDPLADKFLQVAAILCLALWWQDGLLIPAIVIFAKEACMVLGGIFLFRRRKLVVYSNLFGKGSAFFFNIVICLVFFKDVWFRSPQGLQFLKILVIIAVTVSVISMFQYGLIAIYRPEKYLHREEKEE